MGNVRTVTRNLGMEKGKQTNGQTNDLLFELKLFMIFIFVFENCQNSFLWVPRFAPFWSAKHLNFGDESREVRILSRSIQETYTLTKVKKPGFTFFYQVENQICSMSWCTTRENLFPVLFSENSSLCHFSIKAGFSSIPTNR